MIEIGRENITMERPLFWHGAAFIAGIGLGFSLNLSFYWYLLLFSLALLSGIVARIRKNPWLLLLLPLVFGIYWSNSGIREPEPFPFGDSQPLEIYGMALNNSVPNEKGIYSFYLKPFEINGSDYRGGNLLVYGGVGNIFYGDCLDIKGEKLPVKSYHNQHGFDYQKYLLQNNIVAIISTLRGGEIVTTGENRGNPLLKFSAQVSSNLLESINNLPDNQGDLLRGVFLGDKSGLGTIEKNTLIKTGIIHAFAVSGLHVGYLLGFVLLLTGVKRSKRWLRLALGGSLVIFYLSLVGFSPSVVRASIMALIGLWAFCIDEKPDPYVTLMVAAVLILIYRPALLFNAGFQLSFLATFGIFYLQPLFDAILPKQKLPLRQAFITSFSAAWAVMPVTAYYFHIASLSGFLVSPILLMAIGLVILICLLASIFAVFSAFLAALPLYAGGLLIGAVYRFCDLLSSISFTWLSVGTPGIPLTITYYLLLLALPLLIKKAPRFVLVISTLSLVLLITLPLGGVKAGDSAPFDQDSFLKGELMEVVFLDVGQGDAALIIAPDDKTVLIDGGGNGMDDDDYWIGENILLPYLRSRGINKITYIISSHPHSDHLSGLITVLQNLPVKYFLTSENYAGDPNQEKALAICRKDGVQIVYLNKGDRYPLTDRISMDVFSPGHQAVFENDYNAASLVIKISYKEIDFLFTGDVEGDYLLDICNGNIEAEVLKIPHHGSINSYNEEFYRKVDPKYAVISVGEGNSYGHPSSKIIEYFEKENLPLYRTDKDGSVTFITDGISLQASTNR